MEVLMSNWPSVQSIPQNYVLPPEMRPGKIVVPFSKEIPVIDLGKTDGHDRAETIQQILKACQEFGLFQVVNHGVPGELMDEAMKVFKELFSMPAEYKAQFVSDINGKKGCILYSSSLFDRNDSDVRYWKDCFTHSCHPLEEHSQYWPEKPTNYREVVGTYSVEVSKFLHGVLDLMSEGLGIEPGHFRGDLSKIQVMSVNHHIPCPDPTLTLGHPEHLDPNLISTLQQCDVPGLQLFKDGQWIGVEPLPRAFVIISGIQFQVISNGKFTSPKHRVVTHAKEPRTTLGTFFSPADDSVVGPAGNLLNPIFNPPLYSSYKYRDFFNGWMKNVDEETALGRYRLRD